MDFVFAVLLHVALSKISFNFCHYHCLFKSLAPKTNCYGIFTPNDDNKKTIKANIEKLELQPMMQL